MMRAIGIASLVVLAGCAATTSLSTGGAPPGTAAGGASIGVRVDSGPAAGALLGVAILGAAVYGAGDPAMAGDSDRRVPELDPRRTVHVQDCSQPIRDGSANLECR